MHKVLSSYETVLDMSIDPYIAYFKMRQYATFVWFLLTLIFYCLLFYQWLLRVWTLSLAVERRLTFNGVLFVLWIIWFFLIIALYYFYHKRLTSILIVKKALNTFFWNLFINNHTRNYWMQFLHTFFNEIKNLFSITSNNTTQKNITEFLHTSLVQIFEDGETKKYNRLFADTWLSRQVDVVRHDELYTCNFSYGTCTMTEIRSYVIEWSWKTKTLRNVDHMLCYDI